MIDDAFFHQVLLVLYYAFLVEDEGAEYGLFDSCLSNKVLWEYQIQPFFLLKTLVGCNY